MPTYEYECTACDSLFERRQRFDEEPIGVCPHCQGKSRRLIHSIPVIFKGSGFYTTDHRKGQDPEGTQTEAKRDEGAPAKSS